MKITLDPPGQRPSWLKDDDVVVSKIYGDWQTSHSYACKAVELVSWNDTDLLAIEIEDTHPYAVATSRGFTYWPGGESAPDDWDSECHVLLRDGTLWGPSSLMFWPHAFDGRDIIGYHRKAEAEGKVWYLPIKSIALGPVVGAMRKRLVDAQSFFSEGTNHQIVAFTISPSDKLLSAEVVQPPSRADEIRAEIEALRAELERLGRGK